MPHNHSFSDDVEATDIYIVTAGEYSNYSVVAAFSTEEAAKAYADEMNRRKEEWASSYKCERVDFNPPLPALVEEIVRPKTVHVARIEEDKIVDGRQFYRIHCTCNFVSGPLWSKKSAEEYKDTHERGSVW